MKRIFPTLVVLLCLANQTISANAPWVNDDFTALFNSLANKLNDAKGEKANDSDLERKTASVYETPLSLDGNLAYVVFEDAGLRYHQTLFSSESDRLSLLDDLQSYEGEFSVHVLNRGAEEELYKIKKGRTIIGFLQFRQDKKNWTLRSFAAFDQVDFQSNLELVLQSGTNDFAGVKSNITIETTGSVVRYKCNIQLYSASSTNFLDVYDGQVYSIDGAYSNLPFPILKTHLEKINAFNNGFQIEDRESEANSFKLYLSHRGVEYIIGLRGNHKSSFLSVSKDRKNSTATTTTTPPSNTATTPTDVPDLVNNDPTEVTSPQKPTESVATEKKDSKEPELVDTEVVEETPPAPALESGTFAFAGKGGQMGCYTGTIKDGKREGEGVFVAKDGAEWEGQWENDVLVGKVIMRKNTGDVYEGDIKNYQRHGYGTYTWINSGNRFEGDWKNDQRDGAAKYFIAKNGRQFIGTYVDNRIHGIGAWHYKDGTVLEGQFNRGKKEGTFTVTDPDGKTQECTYDGGRLVSSGVVRLIESYGVLECDYIKGLKHGQATVTYNDGTVEQRNYKYGKLNGAVICTYPDGKTQELEYKNNQLLSSGHLKLKLPDGFFEGDFKAGLKQGPGITFYDNEVVEDGSYKAGKKEGAFTLVSPEGDVQVLPYKNNQLIHTGQVRLFYSNGYFDGQLKNGIKSGEGKFVYTNGNVLKGTWKNDKKEGLFKMTYPDKQVAQQVYTNDKLEKSRLIKKTTNCSNNIPTKKIQDSKPTVGTAPERPKRQQVPTEVEVEVEEEEIPNMTSEEMVEQFVLNFKSVAKERNFKLSRHTKGTSVQKEAALAVNAFFDGGKEYLYLVLFKDCSDCDVTVGRGKGNDIQYKEVQIKHEGDFTYAVYSFKSLESNTRPIWAFPNPDKKNGEALLFVRE